MRLTKLYNKLQSVFVNKRGKKIRKFSQTACRIQYWPLWKDITSFMSSPTQLLCNLKQLVNYCHLHYTELDCTSMNNHQRKFVSNLLSKMQANLEIKVRQTGDSFSVNQLTLPLFSDTFIFAKWKVWIPDSLCGISYHN